MITKEQVLIAVEIIEKYKIQEKTNINQIEETAIKAEDKRSIKCLGLKTRENNCLRNAGINTVGELLCESRRGLIKYRNMGAKGILMINKAIKDDGIDTEDFIIR